MHAPRYMLAALVATLAIAWPAQAATTLVGDPAHPLSGRQMATASMWLRESAEPTPAVLYVHRGACPGGIGVVACANVNYDAAAPRGARWYVDNGQMWLGSLSARSASDRFDFMHELGHIMDVETYTPAKRTRIERLLGMIGDWYPDARFDTGTTPPYERAADAFAMCSIHRRWPGTWWHFVIRRSHGMTVAGGNPTPYDFRAGRDRYNAICRAIRTA